MDKTEDKQEQLRLLTRSDAGELSQSKKRAKIKTAGRPSRPSGLLFDNLYR